MVVSDTKSDATQGTSRKRQSRAKGDQALPISSVDALLTILKGYVVASNQGATPVGYREVASISGVSPFVVSSNNPFLEETGLLRQVKRGTYLPVDAVVKFVTELPWDEITAKERLREIMAGSWFGTSLLQQIEVRGAVPEKDAVSNLGRTMRAGEHQKGNLHKLIDLLLYFNVVHQNDDGSISASRDQICTPGLVHSVTTEPIAGEPSLPLPALPGIVPSQFVPGPAVSVSLTINLPDNLTDEYVNRLRNLLTELGVISGSSD